MVVEEMILLLEAQATINLAVVRGMTESLVGVETINFMAVVEKIRLKVEKGMTILMVEVARTKTSAAMDSIMSNLIGTTFSAIQRKNNDCSGEIKTFWRSRGCESIRQGVSH